METRQHYGFTLIETMIYLALFSILFGGALAAAYTIAEGTGKDQTKNMVQQEGDFLVAKINWVLMSGTQSISSPAITPPATSAQSTILTVDKYDGSSVTIYPSGAECEQTSCNMLLQDTSTYPLNNSSVSVKGLIFTHTSASSDGINPESVQVNFTLDAKTQDGKDFSQDFSTIVYLRK